MNFEGLEFDLVFKSSFEFIFLFVKFFVPKGYIIEIFKWTFILMDFYGFSFFDFQNDFTTPTNNIFIMGFDLVLKGFLSD